MFIALFMNFVFIGFYCRKFRIVHAELPIFPPYDKWHHTLKKGITMIFVCCSFYYILPTFKYMPSLLPTFDRSHAWQLYSTSQLGYQVTGPMTQFPTPSNMIMTLGEPVLIPSYYLSLPTIVVGVMKI